MDWIAVGEQLLYQQLLRLSIRLAVTQDEQEIEQTAVSALTQAFAADACAIIRLGSKRGQCVVTALYPAERSPDKVPSQEECQALLSLIPQGHLVQIQKPQRRELQQFFQRLGLQAALLLPLSHKEMPPMLLLLGFAQNKIPLKGEQQALLEQMGGQIAFALERTLENRQNQRRLKELRLLQEVAMSATAAPDLDQFLHQLVGILWRELDLALCGILLLDPQGHCLRLHGSSRGYKGSTEQPPVPLNHGLVGQVLQNGQALLISEGPIAPQIPARSVQPFAQLLYVPVFLDNEALALLELGSHHPGGLLEGDILLLKRVATQAATALQRTRTLQQAGQQVRQLTTLLRVGTAIQRAGRIEEISELILHESIELVGGERGCLLLLDRQSGRLRLAAQQGLPEDIVADMEQAGGIPTSFGTFSILLDQGEMLLIPNPASDPRVERGYLPLPPQLTNIPLKTEQGVLGIIELDGLPADESSRWLLQSMADMAAVAIEQQRILDEIRHRLDEARFLQEIALAATSTLDFDEVLRRSTAALQRRLSFEVFGFLVMDERSNLLRLHPDFVGVPEQVRDFTTPIGEGITGWVAQNGEPYLSGNVLTDPHYSKAVPEIRSEICVPVKIGSQVVAVIDLESTRLDAFGRDDLRLLSAMANQLAIALQNARLYEREQQQHRLAELMRQAAVALGSNQQVADLLDQALLHLERLLPYDAAFLVLFREGEVEQARSRGADCPDPEGWLIPGTLGAGVYAERRAIVLPDVRQSAGWHFWQGVESLRSWVAVPLMAKDTVLGMLLLGAAKANTYTREEATIAFSFAGQLSLALERARFYEQERRQAEQLDLLYRINQRVLGLVDLDQLLEETLLCLNEALHPYQTCLGWIEGDHINVWQMPANPSLPAETPIKRQKPLQGEGILSWVVQKDMPLLVSDVTLDPRSTLDDKDAQVRSEMAVPLRGKGKVIGVLNVQGSQAGQFDERDLSALQAIGNQVSGAIERAILYADLRDTVQQLQEIDNLRRDFLSTINHEMRAPLTAILGFTDFLMREQAGTLSALQREYLGDIRAAGERILSLVENLLEAARLEEGPVRPNCSWIELEEVLGRTICIVQPAAMEKALTLKQDLPADLPPLWADPTMLERILINLLSNAVNYSPPGGLVWVEAQVSQHDEDMLDICVGDTGVGIDPQDFELIFQRYRRLETPAVGKVGGTGLGLYIVQGLVQAHGGRIWVESQLGQGSKFHFTLPLQPST
ncbi:MAG: GAF domain-containing protein [Chloroflexia bacterium]|nr:GAF domain-containing protein [Chloroflexia bacterium]